MTLAAPRALATATAAQPIGPQPKTATVAPSSSPYEQAWTAFPKGSMAAATAGGISGPTGQTFSAGSATRPAKPPSASTPMILVSAQTWKSPRRQAGEGGQEGGGLD